MCRIYHLKITKNEEHYDTRRDKEDNSPHWQGAEQYYRTMNNKIKKYLTANKIPRAEVARRMGVSPQSFNSRLKSKEITLSTLQGVADAVNIELAELCAQLSERSVEDMELIRLRRENEYLKQLLEEKERTIRILMKKSGD